MQGISSSETSWADQWDNEPDTATVSSSKGGGGSGDGTMNKYRKKFDSGMEKTKSIAANGMNKMKEGTTAGFHWVKDKYHNLKNNQKKY